MSYSIGVWLLMYLICNCLHDTPVWRSDLKEENSGYPDIEEDEEQQKCADQLELSKR